jgi:hypothetical protein
LKFDRLNTSCLEQFVGHYVARFGSRGGAAR